MIIEVVFEGNPQKLKWTKRANGWMLLNMVTPPMPNENWILTGPDGTILDRDEPLADQVADGQRIYISRQAGTAA